MVDSPAVNALPGTDFVRHASAQLQPLLAAIVPADDFPSADQAGGLTFLGRVLDERPDWIDRVVRVVSRVNSASASRFGQPFVGLAADRQLAILDGLVADADYAWFARLVNGGYYADPENGGNKGAASWRMIDWRAEPAGGWPAGAFADPPRPRPETPESLAARYDVIVVGSGAGGGVVAAKLAEAGRSVLVVERGGWPTTAELASDHIRNPRSSWGLAPLSGPANDGNPRVFEAESGRHLLWPSDPGWNNNAMTVGGGTRVYGAQAWRFGPIDFAMASHYGVPEGSDLADWPFGYDELAPYYRQAEREIGVAGDRTYGAHGGAPFDGYPMPPLPAGPGRAVLATAAHRLGIATLAVPLLINSVPYLGRPACAQCAMCVGFACPVDAKNGSLNTMLARALATGRCDIIVETAVEKLTTDAGGHVSGVALVGERDDRIWRREIRADEVVLAAGAIETARLLLNSRSDREPDGIGNTLDQVGRRLQGHVYGGAIAVFDDVVEDLVGPGPSIATADFRHGNRGIVGGGILADEFVTIPPNIYRYLGDSGLIPLHGPGAKAGMRRLTRRMARIMGPVQEVTSADSRVRVDPEVRDRFGIPVAMLSGGIHAEDLRGRAFMTQMSADWLKAAGAREVVPMEGTRTPGPSGGQHQAGTCRMGTDPAKSATDPYGRVWGHANLRVADGSLHVTNGGVNPVLTIYANAFRIADHMVRGATGEA